MPKPDYTVIQSDDGTMHAQLTYDRFGAITGITVKRPRFGLSTEIYSLWVEDLEALNSPEAEIPDWAAFGASVLFDRL